jgi:oligopeptidase B
MTMGKLWLAFRIALLVLLAGACTTSPQSAPQGQRPSTSAASAKTATQAAALTPPVAAKKPYQVTSPNGSREDEYYWLRDDTRQSKEMLDYLKAENAYRDAVMAHTAGVRKQLFDEMVARLDPDESSVPVLEHGYWYYTRYVPGKDYPIYARRKGSMEAPEEVLLDGNAMSQGHEFFQLSSVTASPDGKLLAYALDTVGRRQYVLHVKDLASGETLPDTIDNIQPNIVWANDNRTLFYVDKDPVTLLSERIYKHVLGSDREKDQLVYEEQDHTYYIGVTKSRSEKYVFIYSSATQQSEWRFADANDPKLRFNVVLPREADHEYNVEHIGNDFVLRTNWQAPNFRIVRVSIAARADRGAWRDVIAHRTDAFLEGFEVSSGYIAVNERSGGLMKMRVKAWDGSKDVLIDADEPSYAMSLHETPGFDSTVVRYGYSSLITPDTVYEYDMQTGRREVKKVERVIGYDPKIYTTEYLQAPARDGKRVPVSIAYRKGTPLDGTSPLYQYAYGSYGSSSDPQLYNEWISLLDRGFVVALAHIRGGQELGRRWYEDGRQLHKKNTFTDFIDVTRYLVQQGYGAKDKVAAEGASAGGLLMGAVANMAPQDYRVIVAYVPFVDAVTTMLDDTIPLTSNEFDEWGNPQEKAFYDYILSYSPYDNVEAKDYPAMIVYTGLWDSQVQYYEPAKWVARLRARKTDDNLLVFSVDMSAGHGGASGRLKQYHDTALEYAFILDQFGM